MITTSDHDRREPQGTSQDHLTPAVSEDVPSGSGAENSASSTFVSERGEVTGKPPLVDDLTSTPVEIAVPSAEVGNITPDTLICIGQLQVNALVNNDVHYEEFLVDNPPWAWVHTQHEHLTPVLPLHLAHLHLPRHPLHIIHILAPGGTSPPRTLAIVEPHIASLLGPLLRDRTVTIQACMQNGASHYVPIHLLAYAKKGRIDYVGKVLRARALMLSHPTFPFDLRGSDFPYFNPHKSQTISSGVHPSKLSSVASASAEHLSRSTKQRTHRPAPYDTSFRRQVEKQRDVPTSSLALSSSNPESVPPEHTRDSEASSSPTNVETPTVADIEVDTTEHGEVIDPVSMTADEVQAWLDHNYEHPSRAKMIQRLVDLSSEQGSDLPTLLFIKGVTTEVGGPPVAGGSFADVFRGSYRGQDVALKCFRFFLKRDDTLKLYNRFYREALIWRQLRHQNILSFLGVDREAMTKRGCMCMVSPWMTQGTLMEYLGSADTSLVVDHRGLILDVAAGLGYLHAQPFVHGDLHGSNVFVDEHHRALLGDFGLTALNEFSHIAPTTTINKAGAVRWLSPELMAQDERHPPRKTTSGDIFAFGRVCLAVYTRLPPFHDVHSDVGVLLKVVAHQDPPRPSKDECHGVDMPDALWDLITVCWSDDVTRRPAIGDVIQRMHQIELQCNCARGIAKS